MSELEQSSLIGRYQLVSPIGAGGMGQVWVALDTAAPARRLVALKTTLEGGASGEFWAMLSDEAALASRIDHPNVCATYELGHDGPTHFLVMDWSDGASLRDLLDAAPGKRISPELAAYIGSGVAAGLHAAHELSDDAGQPLGVVHRDVSPQNVLVSMRGQVRLADFGVAKARGQQHRPTETGEVKGKLSYMAPEQVTSKNIDRRADVFALGCLLYEAALGVRPFHGADALATMYKILEEDLTLPRSVDPSFPEQLQQILVKALTKDMNARYQSADELRAELVDYLSSTRRFFGDKHVAELLSSLLGAKLGERNRAILAAADQLRRGETHRVPLRSPLPPAPTHTLTPEGGVERSVSVARSVPAWRSAGAVLGAAALIVAALVGLNLTRQPRTPSAETPRVSAARSGAVAPAAPSERAVESTAVPVVHSVDAPVSSAAPAGSSKTVTGTHVKNRPLPAVPPDPGLATKPPAKKPRPIDRDNPFSFP